MVDIGFATLGDAQSPLLWSGTPFNMISALTGHGHNVTVLGPLSRIARIPTKVVERIRPSSAGTYVGDRENHVLNSYARQLSRRTRQLDLDFVLTTGVLPAAHFTDAPVVLWSDATVPLMLDYYPEFSGLTQRARRVLRDSERRAFESAALVVMSSDWATQSVISDYDIDPAKTATVMFGANLIPALNRPAQPKTLEAAPRLLTVGANWKRKGMDLCIAATEELRAADGRDWRLDIVGSTPPPGTTPEWVTAHGFLRADVSSDKARLRGIFEQAHVFLMASEAECTPIVLCEASAWGIPAVAADTGGISSVLPPGEGAVMVDTRVPSDWATAVLEVTANYTHFTSASRQQYLTRLNWGSSVSRTVERALEILDVQ